MRHFLILCTLLASVFTGSAQTVIDNFTVGPYVVDYNGKGDITYRLRDNIDLYEFYELQRDTTIISAITETPLKHAIQISGRLGANRYSSKDIGLEGVWKQNIGNNLYFNGGLSLTIGNTHSTEAKRNMMEIGIPLQIELGKLNHQSASFYGLFGITPAFYSTLSATKWLASGKKYVDDVKKSGFLIAPALEFGGNIPLNNTIMRIGVYCTYKINCTPSDFNVYSKVAGRMFLGAKIGVII